MIKVASFLAMLSAAALSAAQVDINDSVTNYAILNGSKMVGQHETSTSHVAYRGANVIYIQQKTQMFDEDGSIGSETMLQTWITPAGQPITSVQTILTGGVRNRSTAEFEPNKIKLSDSDGNFRVVAMNDTKSLFGTSIQPLIQQGALIKEKREFYGLNFKDGSLVKGAITYIGDTTIMLQGSSVHVREIDSTVSNQTTKTFIGDDGKPVLIMLANGLTMMPN